MYNTEKQKKPVIDDFTLVRAVQGGDQKAFESLVRRYQRQVANLIYTTMGGSEHVEDLAQEVFIRVYRMIPKYAFEASFFSWIYRITTNICIDELRKRKRRKIISLDFLSETDSLQITKRSSESADSSILTEEKKNVIQSALKRLSPEHRAILILREYEDLGYNEIAEVLDISLEAVKSRIFRARMELRKFIAGYFKE